MSAHPAIELLSSYLDEEVTVKQLHLVESHLEECAKCKRTLEGLKAVSAGVRRLESVEPPPTLGIAMERRIRLAALEDSHTEGLEGSMKRWLGQPVLAPAFAVVLALGAILYLFSYGIAHRDEGRTRLVVASAPSEESRVEEGYAADELADRAADGNGLRDDVVDAPAKTSVAPPGEIAALEVAEADTLGKLEQVGAGGDARERARIESVAAPAASAVMAEAEARSDRMARRESPDPDTAPSADERQVAFVDGLASGARSVAGRVFVRDGTLWVERGLEGEAADELVDLREESAESDADLEPFAELGRARLRLRDRVVEVVYPPPEKP